MANLVYLIQCAKCGVQYVSQTKRSLRKRISEHRLDILHNQKRTSFVRHFNTNDHTLCDMQVRILQQLPSNKSSALLLQVEDFWIRTLCSVYPFGLNEKVKGYGIATDIVDPSLHRNNPYLIVQLPRRKRSHGKKRRTRHVAPEYSFNDIKG
ncbi:MAG: GIY-YIG nuclease family protein [bacterium]|nr:GIY-YIG nuclease family protein [bacterium]